MLREELADHDAVARIAETKLTENYNEIEVDFSLIIPRFS